MFKEHELYPIWEVWIDCKVISKGEKRLMKLSRSNFDDFTKKWESDLEFRERVSFSTKIDIRDLKIEKILK